MILAQLSDLHLDEPGSRHMVRIEHILSVLAQVKPRPDLLLLTGDLTQDGTPSQYALLQELLDNGLPFAMVAGNHDDATLLHASFPCVSPPPGGSLRLEVGPLDLLLVDTTVPGHEHGELSEAQLRTMAGQIDAIGKPVLIAMHHPPVAARVPALDGSGLRQPWALASWLGARPGVVGLLAGHYHQAQFSQLAGRPVLVAPPVAPSLIPDFQASGFQTEATSSPAAYLHLWNGALSSHLLVAAMPGQARIHEEVLL